VARKPLSQVRPDPDAIRYHYVGNGNFLGGVPARDLTYTDWMALDVATQQQVLTLQLYTPPVEELVEEAPDAAA
jgi:hypothetical protein